MWIRSCYIVELFPSYLGYFVCSIKNHLVFFSNQGRIELNIQRGSIRKWKRKIHVGPTIQSHVLRFSRCLSYFTCIESFLCGSASNVLVPLTHLSITSSLPDLKLLMTAIWISKIYWIVGAGNRQQHKTCLI